MPVKDQNLRRYIIMSSSGYLDASLTSTSLRPSTNMVAVSARAEAVTPAPQMRVLDALHENGPKLVEMSAEGELSLRLSVPGLKIVPEVFYHRQWQRFGITNVPPNPGRPNPRSKKRLAIAPEVARLQYRRRFNVAVTGSNGTPIKGPRLSPTNFKAREGASATTDSKRARQTERPHVEPQARTRLYLCAGRFLGTLRDQHHRVEIIQG
jgi:hypothetical protein